MFPPRNHWPRYESLSRRKLTKRGDISACSALTIHRGTANRSDKARPTLVLGVDALGAGNAAHHDLTNTRDCIAVHVWRAQAGFPITPSV
jgi:hypothetical protein